MHIGIYVHRPSSLKDTKSFLVGPWTVATADLSDRANEWPFRIEAKIRNDQMKDLR
jgi:hypothetical protein